jgi:hypothetical protein
MHRAALAPDRRTDRAHARPPSALLPPQFAARAGNFAAALGLVRSGALSGQIPAHRSCSRYWIHRSAAKPASASSTWPTFLPSRFRTSTTAMSSRPLPANCSADRRAYLRAWPCDQEIASPRPGTAPRTSKRFSSLSTLTTRRFLRSPLVAHVSGEMLPLPHARRERTGADAAGRG